MRTINTETSKPSLAFVPFSEEILDQLSKSTSNRRVHAKNRCPKLVPFDLKYMTVEVLVEKQWLPVAAA